MMHDNCVSVIAALWVVMPLGLAAIVAVKMVMAFSQWQQVKKRFCTTVVLLYGVI